jgi:hypothetical protein
MKNSIGVGCAFLDMNVCLSIRQQCLKLIDDSGNNKY